jgi:hypothetical protein
MLRHGCGFALANAGHYIRSLQAWLGHRNIQHTVRYTELMFERFVARLDRLAESQTAAESNALEQILMAIIGAAGIRSGRVPGSARGFECTHLYHLTN